MSSNIKRSLRYTVNSHAVGESPCRYKIKLDIYPCVNINVTTQEKPFNRAEDSGFFDEFLMCQNQHDIPDYLSHLQGGH